MLRNQRILGTDYADGERIYADSCPYEDGLTSEIWWSPNHPFSSSLTGQNSPELAAAYENETGKQWTQPIGLN